MNGSNLKTLLKALKISTRKCEQDLELKTNRLQKVIERDSSVDPDIINKILEIYPQVNKYWMLTGEGNMFITNKSEIPNPGSRENSRPDELPTDVKDSLSSQSTKNYQAMNDRLLAIIEKDQRIRADTATADLLKSKALEELSHAQLIFARQLSGDMGESKEG